MSRLHRLAGLLLATLVSGVFAIRVLALEAGTGLEFLRLPIGAQVSWVGKDIQQNGMLLDIQVFRSSQRVASVLEFYRELWENNATADTPGYHEHAVADWSVISTLENTTTIVLQIKPGLHELTEGFVSALDTSRPALVNALPVDIPLPAGSTLLSRTATTDTARPGITLILESTDSVLDNYRFYRERMRRFGWQLSTTSASSDQAALLFEKPDEFCEISINTTAAGKSLLLLNHVSRGG